MHTIVYIVRAHKSKTHNRQKIDEKTIYNQLFKRDFPARISE